MLEYDDVANDQRKVIYHQRFELMAAEDISETIKGIIEDVMQTTLNTYIPPQSLEEQWDISGLRTTPSKDFGSKISVKEWLDKEENLYRRKFEGAYCR